MTEEPGGYATNRGYSLLSTDEFIHRLRRQQEDERKRVAELEAALDKASSTNADELIQLRQRVVELEKARCPYHECPAHGMQSQIATLRHRVSLWREDCHNAQSWARVWKAKAKVDRKGWMESNPDPWFIRCGELGLPTCCAKCGSPEDVKQAEPLCAKCRGPEGDRLVYEDDLSHYCGDCGTELQHVRPGKWQCPECQ